MSDDTTFKDEHGVTHEALRTILDQAMFGDVSLCGLSRHPVVVNNVRTLRALAQSQAPDNVDCMSCLVRRTELDLVIGNEPHNPLSTLVPVRLKVTW